MIKRALSLPVIALLLFAIGGCAGLMKDIELSSLMQKKKHHELINTLQPEVDRGESVSSFRLFMLCSAYYEIRDYRRTLAALDLFDKKLAAGDDNFEGLDLVPYAPILRGNVYLDMGEYDKAIAEANRADGLLKARKRTSFYEHQLLETCGILGVGHAFQNRMEEAGNYAERIRAIKVGFTNIGPEKSIAIAKICMAMKNYEGALAAVQDPDAKVSAVLTAFYDQTFQELPKFFILTKCLYETGKTAEARDGYDQLLKHPNIRQIGGIYWPVLLDRARIARMDGDHGKAETLLKEAMDVIETQRSSINSEAGRIGYVGDKQSVYQEMIDILLAAQRFAEAFETVERAKGRALVDLLASQKKFARGAGPQGRSAGRRDRVAELAQAEADSGVIAGAKTGQGASSTRSVVISLRKELARESPELASLVTVTAASLQDVQERLAADESLVEFYETGKGWVVFVVKRSSVAARRLSCQNLSRAVREFREAVTNPGSDDYLRRSKNLYADLLGPVSSLLGRKLVIVPHGELHYLPFSALSPGKGFLVDRKSVRILQNAGVLAFLRKTEKTRNPRTLILGNPNLGDPRYDLKYAQDEALAIARMLPNSTILLRDDAKAAFVGRSAGQFNIIHFAAHGIFDTDNPLNSALLLARDAGDDGMLRAGDLYGLNLQAELVTLSACETALGKISRGDDVVGFTRGLLYAGAGSIVSTLWKVDDRATRELMVDFYARLAKSGKDEALRQAQLRTKKKFPHPFYWASFQLTGNAR